MRSNSLDVKLRKTEKELKAHEQEIADQQELHTLTVKELELVKAAHTIAVTECQQLKTKVSCKEPLTWTECDLFTDVGTECPFGRGEE